MAATDSAGVPWAGRAFHAQPFGGDDGSAPGAFLDAMALLRRGEAEQDAVVDALRGVRMLVPLVAELGEGGRDDRGGEKTQELSIVSVRAPDGRVALPVFSSVEAMAAWNPAARPVPTEATRVAAAALGEGADLVIVDATSGATEFVIRRPALVALATGARWVPPHRDPEVRASIDRAAAIEPAVAAVAIVDGDPDARLAGPDVLLAIGLLAGLDADGVRAVIERMQLAWAQDGVVAQRVDSLAVKIEAITERAARPGDR